MTVVEPSPVVNDNWRRTSILGMILVASDLTVLFAGDKFSIDTTYIIASIGVMTFFGLLMISSYHKKNFADHLDKGTMRDAITGSLLSVYFITIGFDMTKGITSSGNPILNNFTSVIIILVAFYFGSKVVTEVYKPKDNTAGNGTAGKPADGQNKAKQV